MIENNDTKHKLNVYFLTFNAGNRQQTKQQLQD